jgi:hypothetical protein
MTNDELTRIIASTSEHTYLNSANALNELTNTIADSIKSTKNEDILSAISQALTAYTISVIGLSTKNTIKVLKETGNFSLPSD